MAAPRSAQRLPNQTPNNSQEIARVDEDIELRVSEDGKMARGKVTLSAFVTSSWRYLFGTFAQTSLDIDPNFSQTISNPPTQAQVQALSDQVGLLSRQLGRIR